MAIDASTWLLSATAFAFSMSATPGPNNAMLTASGANYGFVRTIPHMAGIAVGMPAMLLAIALGAGDVLSAWPVLQVGLKWVGAAYLLWLAWRIAIASPALGGAAAAGAEATAAARPLRFVQGALFQWVNPKAWVTALGGIATYTTASSADGFGPAAEAAALAAIFLVVSVPTMAGWTMAGVFAARVLRSARALRAFNLAMAALLVASLIPLLRE